MLSGWMRGRRVFHRIPTTSVERRLGREFSGRCSPMSLPRFSKRSSPICRGLRNPSRRLLGFGWSTGSAQLVGRPGRIPILGSGFDSCGEPLSTAPMDVSARTSKRRRAISFLYSACWERAPFCGEAPFWALRCKGFTGGRTSVFGCRWPQDSPLSGLPNANFGFT